MKRRAQHTRQQLAGFDAKLAQIEYGLSQLEFLMESMSNNVEDWTNREIEQEEWERLIFGYRSLASRVLREIREVHKQAGSDWHNRFLPELRTRFPNS